MSYTLRGRVHSRLAAAGAPFALACALALVAGAWWPVELVAVMLAVGLALDVLVYDRALPYQPAWAALPLGALELGLTMLAVRALDVAAPLEGALWLFAASWLLAQLLGHAALPLLHLTYAEDGGELGAGGRALSLAAPLAGVLVLGVAWASQPTTVTLEAGIHEGPLVLDEPVRLVGEAGAVVRGGIVVRADGVVVDGVSVVGGEHGIQVEDATGVVLEDVSVSGATLDGINVRRGSVRISGCTVRSDGPYVQGIDISFGFDLAPSTVRGCTVTGGLEGIVTHFVHAEVRGNRVYGTSLRGITMTEMSMGSVERNVVADGLGVGIFCGDYSRCRVEDNVVTGIRPDEASGDRTRAGFGILSHFGAVVELGENDVADSPGGVAALVDATIERD